MLNSQNLPYLFALLSTLCFSSASLVFSSYAHKISVLWMNTFKSLIAFLALLITVPLFKQWSTPSAAAVYALMLSGLVGLNFADSFLLRTFTKLGVGRTLILFGFQPLMVGIGAYFLFDQELNPRRFLALIFFIACLITFSLERYRMVKRWEISGLFMALIGVALDACGILLARWAFERSPSFSPLAGNLVRCGGSLLGFTLIARFQPIDLGKHFLAQNPRIRMLLVVAALTGTFLSLFLYLTALKTGNLASISSIAITGPMFATLLECLIRKQKPSRYLLTASAFFCIGFWILTLM